VVVRVNIPLPSTIQDVEAVVGPDILALSIPKVRSAEHVRLLDEMDSQAELRLGIADRPTGFILIVESCDAYFRMADIANARLVFLVYLSNRCWPASFACSSLSSPFLFVER
jgi:citrate lyase subunit beta/citryl-CoA lyase